MEGTAFVTVEMKSIWLQSLCEIYPLCSEAMQDLVTTGYIHIADFGGGLGVVWASPSPAPWPLLRQWWQDKPLVLCHPCHLVLAWTDSSLVLQLTWTEHHQMETSCQGREPLVFWAHQLLDRSPPVAPGDYSDTFSSTVIPPVALHHAWGVSEWLTMQASQ